jgi:hypothetical protein
MQASPFPLMLGERVLRQTESGRLSLTTHRVRFDNPALGSTQLVSLTLDAVASCGLITKSHPWLMAVAIAFGFLGLLGIATNSAAVATPMIVAGIVCAIAYALTRSAVLAIGSASESIVVAADASNRDDAIAFIDAVEEAKLQLLSFGSPQTVPEETVKPVHCTPSLTCRRCGRSVSEMGSAFCSECGQPLEVE